MTTDYEVLETQPANGLSEPVVPAPAGPRIPRREAWLDLPEEYAGFKVKVWVNYPRRLTDNLRSGDPDQLRAALCQIVREHNGWLDEDGNPLPPATVPAFWDTIPDELAACVIMLVGRESSRLPNSLIPTR